jgi:nucleoid-associated protein YgaU
MIISVPCFRPPDGEVEENAMMRFSLRPSGRFVLLFTLSCFFLVFVPGRLQSQETPPEEPKPEEPGKEEPVKTEEPEKPADQVKAEEMPAVAAPPSQEQVQAATAHPSGAHHPPTHLKKVGEHWTPYDPPDPESFPPGAQVHVIESGDTLWDLSAKFLTNAWLWPQIWDVNQYVTDSHWIYPGDPLLIPGSPTVIAEQPPAAAVAPAPTPEPEQEAPVVEEAEVESAQAQEAPSMPPPPPALVPVASDSEIYCSFYITPRFDPPALFIAEREEGAKTELSTGDIVFLSQGTNAGVEAGDLYNVVTPWHDVFHPIRTDEMLGTSVRTLGQLRVIAVQEESATAEILGSCDAIAIGQYLVPFEELSIPLSSPVAFNPTEPLTKGEGGGYIVLVQDDKLSFGQGDVVSIDMGTAEGVQPGDIFTVYREWGGTVEFSSTQMYIEGRQQRAEQYHEDDEKPRYSLAVLGQLVVLSSKEKTSTGKILIAKSEMAVGDRVQLR